MSTAFENYRTAWRAKEHTALADYTDGITSYVVGLAPQQALSYSGVRIAEILYDRLGADLFSRAIDPTERIASHVSDRGTGDWLRQCHTVGINVRTIGSFWNILKYAITLPEHIRGVHLLPIWEPGVVGSLYGMASWNVNSEFLDLEVVGMYPQLRSTEAQLKVVINLLHALGKVVGMDVIPHTDRYSEIVLANPAYFEWLRRHDLVISDHRADLHAEVEIHILDWLKMQDHRVNYTPAAFFREVTEEERLVLLFGRPEDTFRRRNRRVSLIDYLFRRGYEPVPATMAPPYRGLEVDPDPTALTIDATGRRWRDYRITRPTAMSRVFGPLARYKFYGRLNDNRDWAIDFERPRPAVWEYFTASYARERARYNFDFMRGDMSHVQMRAAGVPEHIDAFYDPLRAVKRRVGAEAPYFAYFAESFLADPDVMTYGSETEHLIASEAEVALGNLQSMVPGSEEFLDTLTAYLELAQATPVTPAFTVITADKDDPRFDAFHHHGEVARLFTGLFLGQLPLYYSLGFEQRDRHFHPAPNEYYTKLYVFQEEHGPKSVTGPWRWGANLDLFAAFQRVHALAVEILPQLLPAQTRVHVSSDGLVRWERSAGGDAAGYRFLANFGAEPIALEAATGTKPEVVFAWPSTFEVNGPQGLLPSGAVCCLRERLPQR